MADKNYFITGITELLILSILEKHDSYVYEITKDVADFSHGILNISQNTVYTATYKLETEGRISAHSRLVGKKRTRIYYRMEESGRRYLAELRQNYQSTVMGVQNIMFQLDSGIIEQREKEHKESDEQSDE